MKGKLKMVLKILLIDMFIIAIFMYLIILGANKDKTVEERKLEDKEQIEYLKRYSLRRQKSGKKN